jgi:hypothetical protein
MHACFHGFAVSLGFMQTPPKSLRVESMCNLFFSGSANIKFHLVHLSPLVGDSLGSVRILHCGL